MCFAGDQEDETTKPTSKKMGNSVQSDDSNNIRAPSSSTASDFVKPHYHLQTIIHKYNSLFFVTPNDDGESPPSTTVCFPLYVQVVTALAVASLVMKFSKRFPHVLSEAGKEIFVPAWYHYDALNTRFDNTIWTYATDYMVAAIMAYGSYKCLITTTTSTSLGFKSAALFMCYGISVLAGGWAHQYYTTLDSLNSTPFRILWTICVGNVAAGGGYIGSIGSELCRKLHHHNKNRGLVVCRLPVLSDWVWVAYGMYMCLVCCAGGISHKRPACDIFVAGVTQTVPTAYCEMVLYLRKWKDAGRAEYPSHDNDDDTMNIRRPYRLMFYIGFILMAPLLPAYPLAVKYTNLELGHINAILHACLSIAWGMQALSLHHILMTLDDRDSHKREEEEDETTLKKLNPKNCLDQ